MNEIEEEQARRLIDGYAQQRDEERRRVLLDLAATVLASQDAKFSDGIRLGADLLAYTARRWRGVDEEEHALHLAWADSVQADLAALFVERGASYPQALLALAHFQATVALALREPDDGEDKARPESGDQGPGG